MKRFMLNSLCLMVLSLSMAQTTINSEERKKALDHLKETQSELLSTVKGLNDAQLNYKADETSWSIAECMEHIAISEKNIIGMVHVSLKEDADPSKRSEVAMDDQQILSLITSREQKVQTRKEFEPTNSFGGYDETVKAFKERRKSNMKFLKTSEEDLRNHYMQFPFGLIDSYQGILFMSGHTQRHTDQIKEIIESDGFPG
ncbi:DinB superfamily protein [Ekhidna lutea]|uniref:DinB superfamily protein n=1 Tax=Ekhidna lutea TaxID=447679 RepID=A0A239H4W0_EKHLU|nr:DinB family protein [Ekhidna lutea]SNS76252.1 DinB superfamily protein [Ekhidna lutea]